jgi:hypothetical protein
MTGNVEMASPPMERKPIADTNVSAEQSRVPCPVSNGKLKAA